MSTSHKEHGGDRIREAAEKAKGEASDHIDTAAEKAKRMAHDVADSVRDNANAILEQGQAKASEVADRVTDHVQEHTGSSLLLAALFGFAVGLIVSWRRSD
jgi:ElaB/YqjD/DUF883 family membrane-anchored ribosome-binding protein